MGALTAQAQKTPVWCDPNVNEINRKMDVANYFAYESEALAQQSQTPKANPKAKSSRYHARPAVGLRTRSARERRPSRASPPAPQL